MNFGKPCHLLSIKSECKFECSSRRQKRCSEMITLNIISVYFPHGSLSQRISVAKISVLHFLIFCDNSCMRTVMKLDH